jgi:hypothetical protein
MRELKPNEKILEMNYERAVTNQRTLTRVALRLMDRPSFSTIDDNAWLAKYPPIRRPAA